MKKLIIGIMIALSVGTVSAETETMEYHYTVENGDTIWNICERIATKDENLKRIVNETAMRNHIYDCENLQVGQEIVIVVERQNFFSHKVK